MITYSGSGDLVSPFVLWDNVLADGVLTSSGVTNAAGLAGFETYDPATFAAGNSYVQVVLPAAVSCDCIALAGHNLAAVAGYFLAQYSVDGATAWTSLPLQYPADGSPGGVVFPAISAKGWRWYKTSPALGAAVKISVGAIGKRLVLPGALAAPYAPADFSVKSEVQIAQSMGGHYLGASQYPLGRKSEIKISALPLSLVEGAEFLAFRDHFNAGKPFWFGASPSRMARDLSYVWRSGDDLAVTYRPGNALADIQMTVGGYGG